MSSDNPLPKKCMICRHQSKGLCDWTKKACSDVQDDKEFDICHISLQDPLWEIKTKEKRKKHVNKIEHST